MTSLLTLDEAKSDLRVIDDSSDADISLKCEMASAMVVEFVTNPDPDWDAESAPLPIKAAVMLTLRDLFSLDESSGLTETVMNLLRATGYRDPGLA